MDKVTKMSVLALSIAAALPMAASADVMITEYVEGTGYSKAVEIYNSGASAIDLTGYSLVYYSKGETAPKTILDLSGNLDAEGIKVIINNHADNAIVLDSSIDTESATIYFNGDDKVGILKDGVLVDILGEVGTTGDWAKDVTIERNAGITAANSSYVASEWTTKGTNDFGGLGVRTGNFDGGEAPEVPAFSCTGETITPIYKVQGAGDSSPLVPDGEYVSVDTVTIKGIVTARGESLQKGFYLQEAQGDGSPYTSDGVFVYLGNKAADGIQPGVEVCVKGLVQEMYGQTQIAGDATKIEIGEQGEELAPTPFYVADGENLAQALERYEGMHIVLDAGSDMKISRNFSFDYSSYRNNMVLSHKAPLMKPTQVHAPLSDAAVALQQANRINELFVESDYKASNGEVPYFPDFNAETGYMRVGDQVTNISGVIGYSYNNYRLVVTNEITAGDLIRENDRTDAPAIATQGDIRVASFNVLNFFNDMVGGDDTPNGNRGASTEEEMLLQRTKLVNAITAMNADIVGLMEIANNGFGEMSAIRNLLDALNAELSDENAYSFIEISDEDKYQGKFIGSDAITVGILYRAASVTPENAAFVIKTPEQHAAEGVASRGEDETSPAYDKYQRHSLGQTFKIHDEKLTIVVNHLKSKGSECLEDWVEFAEDEDPADLQGHCNEFRVSAAKVIGEALTDIEGDLLVIGDMNAYGMEDPIAVLTDYDAATAEREIVTASWTTLDGVIYEREGSKIDKGYGLINLNTQAHGPATYSYSYSGELGNLDHALGNASVAERMVAIEDWHINAVESNLFEYSGKYTGDLEKSENAFSASDHDPVIVALSYPEPTPEPTPKPDDGGSLGYLGLAMLSLLGLRRRKH
ncbi:GlyGly-CTERM domain [Shewanella psychrophila]|uniref:GlyGly-CTERM domain n=1 Tax=Shewanella psychrophila TaxID=225848 RepID=A0A1S6HR50_9GAMM|nr:extracellular exonuclease ExeM [Shewanella psychrophila]AQS37999.1 GlyGly-CTERM domain [Shewanella psychrophila]